VAVAKDHIGVALVAQSTVIKIVIQAAHENWAIAFADSHHFRGRDNLRFQNGAARIQIFNTMAGEAEIGVPVADGQKAKTVIAVISIAADLPRACSGRRTTPYTHLIKIWCRIRDTQASTL